MIEVRPLSPHEIAERLDELAALRIGVFRSWPYLYEGSLDYERAYLRPYLQSPSALVTGVLHGNRLIGASTAIPLDEQSNDFIAPFARRPEMPETILYGGESLLLPIYRGRGIGAQFFDLREAHARALGKRHVAFCSIVRPENHPSRPANARDNEGFWTRRGYLPLPGVIAELDWRDRNDTEDSTHQLQFWMRTLP